MITGDILFNVPYSYIPHTFQEIPYQGSLHFNFHTAFPDGNKHLLNNIPGIFPRMYYP